MIYNAQTEFKFSWTYCLDISILLINIVQVTGILNEHIKFELNRKNRLETSILL